MFLNDFFEGEHELLSPRRFIVGAGEVFMISLDPENLARAGIGFESVGLVDEFGGAFCVVYIGHGDAPIRHGAIRVQGSNLPERTLCFEIPETVKLSNALIEEGLRLRVLALDFDFDLTGTGHEDGALSRAFVESFTVKGVPGSNFLGLGFLARASEGGHERHRDNQREHQGWSTATCGRHHELEYAPMRTAAQLGFTGSMSGFFWMKGAHC